MWFIHLKNCDKNYKIIDCNNDVIIYTLNNSIDIAIQHRTTLYYNEWVHTLGVSVEIELKMDW